MPKAPVAPPADHHLKFPCRVKVIRRPDNPTLVGVTGTAVGWTNELQVRVEVDLHPEVKWARVVLCEPFELTEHDGSTVVARRREAPASRLSSMRRARDNTRRR